MEETTIVTIKHLTNSLAQIEYWTKAVRMALATLPPDTELTLISKVAAQWKHESPILTGKSCPPPE